eukprot:scaffold3388_cov62-Attheya_sp.AAC.2
MSTDDISPVKHDTLKRAMKLSCISFAHDDQKHKYYGDETVERCPSSDIKVMHFVDGKVEDTSSSSSSVIYREIVYQMLRKLHNNEQEMAVALVASKGINQFYQAPGGRIELSSVPRDSNTF